MHPSPFATLARMMVLGIKIPVMPQRNIRDTLRIFLQLNRKITKCLVEKDSTGPFPSIYSFLGFATSSRLLQLDINCTEIFTSLSLRSGCLTDFWFVSPSFLPLELRRQVGSHE